MLESTEILKWLIEFLLLPIIIIYLYDLFNFIKFYNNLCQEIDDNFKKMQTIELNNQFERMRRIFQDNLNTPTRNEWVGFAKVISIWTLAEKNDTIETDYYRYLSNNELKNFIRQGYYEYIKPNEEQLTLYYLDCENFSIDEQNLEKTIRDEFNYPALASLSTDRQQALLERKISEIQCIIDRDQSKILEGYRAIHPSFYRGWHHGIKLYLMESSFVKYLRGILMSLKQFTFHRNLIEPNKWVILNSAFVVFFFICIWGSAIWANSNPDKDILIKTIALTASYFGFALSFAALPFVLLYRVGNQQIRFGVRFVSIISLFFLLMLVSYGIIEFLFPNAPKFMIEATTAFISAIVGGFVALTLNDIKNSN